MILQSRVVRQRLLHRNAPPRRTMSVSVPENSTASVVSQRSTPSSTSRATSVAVIAFAQEQTSNRSSNVTFSGAPTFRTPATPCAMIRSPRDTIAAAPGIFARAITGAITFAMSTGKPSTSPLAVVTAATGH